MEDVLDVYERPYDEKYPVVCMDEKPYQLLGEVREPLPVRPGSDQKIDSEYIRNGTCSIFAFVEPLGGNHHVSVREHRTATDWAEEIKYLSDVMYPDAEKIVPVMDNLNTHKPASLYKRYLPEEARRIIRRLEIFPKSVSIWRLFLRRNTYAHGLTPTNNESAGKKKSVRVSKAGCHIKPLLVQCANAVVKSSKHSEMRNRYLRLKKHRGHKKAIITIARMLLTTLYHMLKNGENYNSELYRKSDLPPADREITVEQAILIPRNQGYKIKSATA